MQIGREYVPLTRGKPLTIGKYACGQFPNWGQFPPIIIQPLGGGKGYQPTPSMAPTTPIYTRLPYLRVTNICGFNLT